MNPFLSMTIQHLMISIFFSFYPMTLSLWTSSLISMVVKKKCILHFYLLQANTQFIKPIIMVLLVFELIIKDVFNKVITQMKN